MLVCLLVFPIVNFDVGEEAYGTAQIGCLVIPAVPPTYGLSRGPSVYLRVLCDLQNRGMVTAADPHVNGRMLKGPIVKHDSSSSIVTSDITFLGV